MTTTEVLQAIRNPKSLTADQLKAVERMASDYPYFQGAHTLLAIGRKKLALPNSKASLAKAAVYAIDRKYLKQIVNGSQWPISTGGEPANCFIDEEIPSDDEHTEITYVTSASPAVKAPETLAPAPGESAAQPALVVARPQTPSYPADDSPYNIERISESDHKTLLHNIFENLESLKASKQHYLEVERRLEDAEFEEAQAKALQKAKKKQEAVKDSSKASSKKAPAPKKKVLKEEQVPDSAPENISSPLHASPIAPGSEHQPSEKKELDKNTKIDIIDTFIKNNPSIRSNKPGFNDDTRADLSEYSQQLKEELISENMARILTLQGKREKAIEIYQKLILKIPEKRAYFAAQIEALLK